MCSKKIFLILMWLFLGAASVQAQTDRFVAPGGSVGTNACTDSLNPCATIQHALDQADDGDTIYLEEGEYDETLQIVKSITISGSNPKTTFLQPPSGLDVPVAVLLPTGGANNITFFGLTIRNGRAQTAQGFRGGGIFNDGNNLTLVNTIFWGNSANEGGGVYNNGGVLNVVNALFTENEAINGGSAFYNNNTEVTITNSTFADNGLNHRTITQAGSTLEIGNSIFWGNADFLPGHDIRNIDDADIFISYSIVQQGCTITGVDCDNVINTNPLFEDAGAGDYRIQHYPLISPAIAFGDPATDPSLFPTNGSGIPVDLAGNPRFKNGRIDPGATEHQGFQPDTNNILYVHHGTSVSDHSGSSWQNGLNTVFGLADALKWAHLNRNEGLWDENDPLQIWVFAGPSGTQYNTVYNPATENLIQGGSNSLFLMVKDVQVYGGFDTTESTPDDRDLSARGEIILHSAGSGFHTVLFAGDTGVARLDGFTITGATSDVLDNGSFTINGETVENLHGGGIYNVNSSPILANLTIRDNNVGGFGGGIYNENSSPEVMNVSVTENTSANGGGIYNRNSSPAIRNILIAENTAGGGGGMFSTEGSEPVLTNATISNNLSSEGLGGALYNESSSPEFNNTIIWGNEAVAIQEIYNDNNSTVVFNHSIYSNDSGDIEEGGGITATNSMTSNPGFNDPGDADYTLQGSSDAVNNGDNTLYTNAGGNLASDVDVALNERVVNGTIDIGAYEFQDIPLPASPFLTSPLNGSEDIHLPVTLEWEAANGAENYRVQVTLSGNSFDDAVFDEIISETDIEVPGLSELTEYQWRVAAQNGTGQGGWSEVWSFTTREPFIPFITIWKTDNEGDSDDTEITIPTHLGGSYNYNIYWEEVGNSGNNGTINGITASQPYTIEFPAAGTYQIEITGIFPRFHFSDGGDKDKILSVEQWGHIQWLNMQGMFQGTSSLEIHATDAPNLENVGSMMNMFRDATSVNSDFSHWDVSGIVNMQGMFLRAENFNKNLGAWDITNVEDMTSMLSNSGLSVENYDATLQGWAAQPVQQNVTLHALDLEYCAAADARQSLIEDHGWAINGDSMAEDCVPGLGTITLRIEFSGSGTGAVSSDPPGVIDCHSFLPSGSCEAQLELMLLEEAEELEITAIPDSSSNFVEFCITDGESGEFCFPEGENPVHFMAVEGELDSGTVITLTARFEPAIDGEDRRVLASNKSDYTFTASDFGSITEGYSVKIETLPHQGELQFNDTGVITGQVISAADINDGGLTWTHITDDHGYNYTSFEFRIVSNTDAESDDAYTMAIDLGAASLQLTESAGEGWRFLTSPSAGDTFGDFLSSIHTQGIPGSADPGTTPSSLYKINQEDYEWDNGFQMSDEIGVGEPFIAYLFEDDLPAELTSGEEWIPLDGSYEYSGLWFDPDQGEHGDSHFLIANPHPVALDFCEFVSGNISPFADIWNPAMGDGDYINLVCGVNDVHIAPFQAFWVQTTDDGPSLAIPEEAYLASSEAGYFKQMSSPVNEKVLLLNVTGEDSRFTNRVQLLFTDGKTPAAGLIDAPKLSATGLAKRWLSFYALSDEPGRYAFRTITEKVDEPVVVPLGIETTESGSYNLTWTLPEHSSISGAFFLRDTQTGFLTELRDGANYRFDVEASMVARTGENASPKNTAEKTPSEPRFELIVTNENLQETNDLPTSIALNQNYPNPFNPTTVISFELPQAEQVRLDVFDMTGRRIATLVDGQAAAGYHQINFDAGNFSSGVYFYRLQAGGQLLTKQLTLIK